MSLVMVSVPDLLIRRYLTPPQRGHFITPPDLPVPVRSLKYRELINMFAHLGWLSGTADYGSPQSFADHRVTFHKHHCFRCVNMD